MRKKELIHKRDCKIVQMFHELYDVKRKRMDDVLSELSEEHFFLDPDYIYSRIFYHSDNNKYYRELLSAKQQRLQK